MNPSDLALARRLHNNDIPSQYYHIDCIFNRLTSCSSSTRISTLQLANMPKIYTSDFPLQPVRNESVFTWLCSTYFHNFPSSKPAFIDAATGFTVTRQQFKDYSLQLAHGLTRYAPLNAGLLPLKRGDAIMIFSSNSIAFPIIMFGAFAAGLVPTLANSAYTWRELAFQWKDSQAKILLVHPALLGVALEMFEKDLGISKQEAKKRIVLAEWTQDESTKDSLKTTGFVHLMDLIGKGQLAEEEKFEGELAGETALLCYSSGTTGNPKGVMVRLLTASHWQRP